MKPLIALLLLLAPAPTWAGAAEVAATLKDTASECRYLLGLCQTIRDSHTKSTAALGNHKTDDAGVYLHRWTQALNDILAAAPIIRAKHDKMPACFLRCRDVVKLDAFK